MNNEEILTIETHKNFSYALESATRTKIDRINNMPRRVRTIDQWNRDQKKLTMAIKHCRNTMRSGVTWDDILTSDDGNEQVLIWGVGPGYIMAEAKNGGDYKLIAQKGSFRAIPVWMEGTTETIPELYFPFTTAAAVDADTPEASEADDE